MNTRKSEAPIIPGESAAGIKLGSAIEEILKEQEPHFISEEVANPWFFYRSSLDIVQRWLICG